MEDQNPPEKIIVQGELFEVQPRVGEFLEQTYGEIAVKLHPSDKPKVSRVKQLTAALIDEMNEQRKTSKDEPIKKNYTDVIRELQKYMNRFIQVTVRNA